MHPRAAELTGPGVTLSMDGSEYNPSDPVGRLLSHVLSMSAESAPNLIRMRVRSPGRQVALSRRNPFPGDLRLRRDGSAPHGPTVRSSAWRPQEGTRSHDRIGGSPAGSAASRDLIRGFVAHPLGVRRP
ncbi:hypothetical protein GCM10009767_20230 [Kocuria aegyptia]|uniref:Uncharacterized protein n=1 Tax=Kocuria aegyptia TaxID=330943 RepID=A0ABN2KR42_9MICC